MNRIRFQRILHLLPMLLLLSLTFTLGVSASPAENAPAVRVGSRIADLLGKEKEPPLRLFPGGEVFGARIREDRVVVTSVDEKEGAARVLRVGDEILSVNGMDAESAADVCDAVKNSGGHLTLTVRRGGREVTLNAEAKETAGVYRLGITVRDGAAGIGTVTFITEDGKYFGGLGHGICTPETGEIAAMREGAVCDVALGGVVRGAIGRAGELSGVLKKQVRGDLTANGTCGVFGYFYQPAVPRTGAVPAASKDEVHAGKATIRSTVRAGEIGEYEVEIFDVDYDAQGSKCFAVKVTDPALIAQTGGIVRGMSGSPILQDGKLIGAVTHVTLADPTVGYGIFLDHMLAAMQEAKEAA